MTEITNIYGIANPVLQPAAHASNAIQNVQSKQGFWRKIVHSKDLITLESSTGGHVQIPIAELWKLGESNDANLIPPN